MQKGSFQECQTSSLAQFGPDRLIVCATVSSLQPTNTGISTGCATTVTVFKKKSLISPEFSEAVTGKRHLVTKKDAPLGIRQRNLCLETQYFVVKIEHLIDAAAFISFLQFATVYGPKPESLSKRKLVALKKWKNNLGIVLGKRFGSRCNAYQI